MTRYAQMRDWKWIPHIRTAIETHSCMYIHSPVDREALVFSPTAYTQSHDTKEIPSQIRIYVTTVPMLHLTDLRIFDNRESSVYRAKSVVQWPST